jgi:hypothetical protein
VDSAHRLGAFDIRRAVAPRYVIPLPLQSRSSDEFAPLRPRRIDRRVAARAFETAHGNARRLGMYAADLLADRRGSAALLRALNEEHSEEFYVVSEAAESDADAADADLGGHQLIVDVQTHYVAQERHTQPSAQAVLAFIRSVAPERFGDLNGAAGLSFAEYLRFVFVESETDIALLTAAPGEGDHNILTNPEIAATRELLDRLGGDGRLLHHSIVHPNVAGELDRMPDLIDRFSPIGWKVYTLYGESSEGRRGWRLDDDETGLPFLQRCEDLGVPMVCAHKGLSSLAPTGSPSDIGPAAKAFPALSFLVYHSGYETEGPDEGPYPVDGPWHGTDRLVRSLLTAGVVPGSNVYAELGSTWFALIRRPAEAAHVLGKLLLAVGEDNVLWGSDSIWYESPQPLIDAFRAFQIPESFQERWGYPALTAEVKEKVLGLNAARVYKINVDQALARRNNDEVEWVRSALAEFRRSGTPS